GLGTDERKALFRQHLLTYVPIATHIRRVLDERPAHHAPFSRFKDELEDYMAEDAADRTLSAVISLARYAEAFAYDGQSSTFSLPRPPRRPPAAPPSLPQGRGAPPPPSGSMGRAVSGD